jgi:glycosyltransferase involved in cell wall biosynthesis
MKIGVNCFPLLDHIGGMRDYFINLFNQILNQDTENEYFFFYGKQNVDILRKINNQQWGEKGLLLISQEDIPNHLKGMDLYFCPFAVLWPRPLPLPTVITLPDIQEFFFPYFFTKWDLYIREYHYCGSTQIADRVITLSHFSRETIVKQHRIPAKKVVVAYPHIDPIFSGPKKIRTELIKTIPFSEFILYPANQWFHKNHDGLLHAIQLLKKKGVKINAVLTGHEMNHGYPLKSKIDEHGLSEQVFVCGYLLKEELSDLYASARMVVFPSLFEGFGIPLLEAMAAGCPIAASQTTSLPEIGGEAVEYFDPHQTKDIARAIEYLWNNSQKRGELIQKGYERLKHFSASNLLQSHLLAFEEAIQSFSIRRYYWQYYWVHPFHRIRVNRKYQNLLRGNKNK